MEFLKRFLIEYCFMMLNLGVACGFLFGVILLLQPLLRRILTPRQRVILWGVVWLCAYMPQWYQITGVVGALLPFTVRDAITPRTGGLWNVPAYLPPEYNGPGEYNLAFVGNGSVPVQLTDAICLAVVLLWIIGAVVVGWRLSQGEKRLRSLGLRGELLEEGHPLYDVLEWEKMKIYLCNDIPTSFICRGKEIFLQKQLPESRRELVLLHESNHKSLWHVQLKTYANVALVLHWWNPMVWLSYFQFCREMELDCDAYTMSKLSSPQRKEYAHTLVELGVGKQMWDAPLSFGECDAALRVKALVGWKQRKWWQIVLTWCLTVAMIMFLSGGTFMETRRLGADVELENQEIAVWWEGYSKGGAMAHVKQHLVEEGRMSHRDSIVEMWSTEGVPYAVLCKLSTGEWYSVKLWASYFYGRIDFYWSNVTTVLSVNLAGYTRIF